MSFQVQDVLKNFGIGLTGGIATGKSTAANIIARMGFTVIDADELSRKVVEPGSSLLCELVETFGPSILNAKGLDRQKLRQMIFSDQNAKRKLESLMHPAIQNELVRTLDILGILAKPRPWFYEAALIFETNRHKLFKSIWVTYCSPATQLKRLMERDHLDQASAKAIIEKQLPINQKKEMADKIINTECSLQELENNIKIALADI